MLTTFENFGDEKFSNLKAVKVGYIDIERCLGYISWNVHFRLDF